MDFRIDSVVTATPAQLWTVFFDIQRIARLIPGCENVEERTALKDYRAVMKQKIGPFKFEMQTDIEVEKLVKEQCVQLRATGRDRFTGTTVAVLLDVSMASQGTTGDAPSSRLDVAATMQVGGRLASLGFGVIKKKSEELFAEFDKRLKAELETL